MTFEPPKSGVAAWTGTAHETVVITIIVEGKSVQLRFPGGRPVRVTDEVYDELHGCGLLIRGERAE